MPRTGYAAIAGAAVLWASIGPAARFALEEGADPLTLSAWRALIAGGLYAVHSLVHRRVRVALADVPGLILFAIGAVAVLFWAYLEAVETGGAALAAILLYTAPAWVAIASSLWLGERLTARTLVALGLTMGGVALVALGGEREAGVRIGAAAIGWGLLSGLGYAAWYLYGKRTFARYEAATIFMYAMPLGGLTLLLGAPPAALSPRAWLVVAYVAIVPTYVAYWLYGRGLRQVPATRAATVATLEPVVAAVLAFAVWGERLGAAALAGGALVLAGVLVTTARTPGNGDA